MPWRGLMFALAVWMAPAAIAAGGLTPLGVGFICSAERDAPPPGGEHRLTMIKGVGTGGFPIATRSREAQAWFDYGMRLAHDFYHQDAVLAFRRAQAIDPACAMCAWGEAWAEGPTINFDVDPPVRRAAGELTDKAAALAVSESPKNRALIAALKLRYVGAPAAADLAYARALDALSRRYPDDNEIAILTADAWIEPYTLRDDGQGLRRAVEVLEPALRRNPDDTGAIHFYIHATEFAGEAERALPYAERLGDLAPASSHLVHMASHTFLRVGRYEEAAVANAKAIGVDGDWLRAAHDGTAQGRVQYHPHNLRFGLAGAMAAGDAPLAVKFADHAAYAFPGPLARDPLARMSIAGAYMALGRYAPDRALALADPGPTEPLAAAMRHYARGEAFALRGNPAAVGAEASALQAGLDAADKTPARLAGAQRSIARIAALTLRGRAAMLEGRPTEALSAYRAAAAIQDSELSGRWDHDPPPWWYPEHRSVAAAMLAMGKPAPAEAEARAALRTWPRDPLSLLVLGRAEAAAGDPSGSRRDVAEAARLWRGGAVAAARL